MIMRRLLPILYLAAPLLAILAVCGCGRGSQTPEKSAIGAFPPPAARILWVSDPKGQLEPCGCTTRPLGGVDRLIGAIEEARKGAPSLLIVSGRLYSDGSTISEELLPQRQLEHRTLARAFERARPDLISHAAAKNEIDELAIAEETEAAMREGYRALRAGEREILIVYGPEPSSALIDEAKRAHPEHFALIVVHSGSRAEASVIAQRGDVDFVLFASGEDDFGPPRALGGGQLLQAGDRGQRLLVLDLYDGEEGRFIDESPLTKERRRQELLSRADDLERRLTQWEASGRHSAEALGEQRKRLEAFRNEAASIEPRPALGGRRAFIAQLVEIDPAIEAARAISSLMLDHDRAVNEANRLAFADTPPLPTSEGMPSYIGSAACASCHADAYAWWEKTRHGRAYQTLVDRHKEFSMNCFQCHVTGYGRPGGATITFNLEGALKNVGCESCHGPGEHHAQSPLAFKSALVRSPEERLCRSCHDAEHSDQFDFEIYRARLLVPGHGL